jgi:hypothetical protein
MHEALAYTYTTGQLFQICYDFRFSLFLACFKVWATHSYAFRVKLVFNTLSHTLGRRETTFVSEFFPRLTTISCLWLCVYID